MSGSSCAGGGKLPFAMPRKIAAGAQAAAQAFFADLERELERVELFRPAGKARHHERQPAQYLPAHGADAAGHPHLHGVINGIGAGPQGPGPRRRARSAQKPECCARCWPTAGEDRVQDERAPVRGLARLLRRNPTEAERVLWQALVKDRRFAGRGFKRQIPIGPHIAGLRLVPAQMRDRSGAAA